jgi:hypothetical protein
MNAKIKADVKAWYEMRERPGIPKRERMGRDCEKPGMQKWHKGPRPKTTTWQQADKGPMWQSAATS